MVSRDVAIGVNEKMRVCEMYSKRPLSEIAELFRFATVSRFASKVLEKFAGSISLGVDLRCLEATLRPLLFVVIYEDIYLHNSNEDPLHLVHRHAIIPTIIKRCRPRRLMRCHLLRRLAPTAIAEILSDTRRPERVIPDSSLDPAANARRRIIRYTSAWARGLVVNSLVRPRVLRNR